MTLLYGLIAGLLVCFPTLAVMTYVSDVAGFLVGLFLLTFFVTTSIYVSEDEVTERLQRITKAIADPEMGLRAKLDALQRQLETHDGQVCPTPSIAYESDTDVERLEHVIGMLDQILAVGHASLQRDGMPSTPSHSESKARISAS